MNQMQPRPKRTLWVFILTLLIAISIYGILPDSHALIIGVGDYEDPTVIQLPGAVHDAQALAGVSKVKKNNRSPAQSVPTEK